MATKKGSSTKKSSSGSKSTAKKKNGKVMHEFKHHELTSGRSGKKVKNRKQAIAIGLSEARRAGADVPKKGTKKKSPAKKKSSAKKSTAKKSTAKKTTRKHATKKSG